MNDTPPEHIVERIGIYSPEQRAIYDQTFDGLIECGTPEQAAAESAHAKAMKWDTIGKPRHSGKKVVHTDSSDTEMEIAAVFAKRAAGSLLYVAGMDWAIIAGHQRSRDVGSREASCIGR